MLPNQNEYRETYARYNAQLTTGQRLETEVRLYDLFPKERRSAEDGPQAMTIYFDRLQAYLMQDVEEVITEYSQVYISGDIRHIVITKDGGEEHIWERKKNLFSRDVADYKMRFALSLEETIDPDPNFVPLLTRQRQRTSFLLPDPRIQARVDLTKSMEITGTPPRATPKWEVEVEFGGNLVYLRNFEEALQRIYCIFRGTDNLYSLSTRDRMIGDIAQLFGARTIPRGALVEARNIKRKDLVYGGIVGNRQLANPDLTTHELHLLVTITDPEYQVTLVRWEKYLTQYYGSESQTFTQQASYDRFQTIRSSAEGIEHRERLHKFEVNGLRQSTLSLVIDQLTKGERTDFVPVTETNESIIEFFPDRAYNVRFIRGSEDPRVEIRFRGGWALIPEFVQLLGELVSNHRWISRSYQPDKFVQDFTKILKRYLSSGTRYALTFKADGERKMLIFHRTGIWLVYPPFEYNLVLPPNRRSEIMTKFEGTILDGEYLIDKSGQPTYLPFDCLTFQGENYQNLPYLARREIIKALIPLIDNVNLRVQVKDLVVVDTPETFFREVRVFLQRRAQLPYREDGLMFIPIDVIYNPESQYVSDRVLTRVPDTCKWKEPRDITIDFAIRPLTNGQYQLLSFDRSTKPASLVPFTGSEINPFTPELIDITIEPTLEAGTVAEYALIDGRLRLKLVRYNKIGRPNALTVAQDNWKDLHDPINALDLSGQSLDMAFAYHNRIKRRLFGLARSAQRVLDLGSGRGGDAAKWKTELRAQKIFAVEPNEANRQELISRVQRFGLNDRVQIIAARGEDSQTITEVVNEKVGCIALMLSLSFFWRNPATLQALVSTIVHNLAPDGIIIFLTIDGDAVQELFHPRLGSALPSSSIQIGPASITLTGEKVNFSLPGTIVGEQEEYLVHITDLVRELAPYGIELMSYHRAQEEKFLSPENAQYTSLYSFGHFQWRTQIPRGFPRLENMGNADSQITDIPTEVNTNVISVTRNRPAPPKLRGQIPAKRPTEQARKMVRPPAPPKPKNPVVVPATSTTTPTTSTSTSTTTTTPTTSTTTPVTSTSTTTPVTSTSTTTPVTSTSTTTPVTSTSTTTSTTAKLPTPAPPKKGPLEWLKVQERDGRDILNGPAINDDTSVPLEASWCDNLYRIATIGDGNCLIHAVLKAIYPPYQASQSARERVTMAKKLRYGLAEYLSMKNPQYPEFTYWESLRNGALVSYALGQLVNPPTDSDIDYSFQGLQRLLRSNKDLGQEAITLLADLLDIDIFLFYGTYKDINLVVNTVNSAAGRMSIALVGNGTHFEVIGVANSDGTFKVAFKDKSDPFIQAIYGAFSKYIQYKDQPKVNLLTEYETFINTTANANSITIPELQDLVRTKIPDRSDPMYAVFIDAVPGRKYEIK